LRYRVSLLQIYCEVDAGVEHWVIAECRIADPRRVSFNTVLSAISAGDPPNRRRHVRNMFLVSLGSRILWAYRIHANAERPPLAQSCDRRSIARNVEHA